jgi:hypothetical protein
VPVGPPCLWASLSVRVRVRHGGNLISHCTRNWRTASAGHTTAARAAVTVVAVQPGLSHWQTMTAPVTVTVTARSARCSRAPCSRTESGSLAGTAIQDWLPARGTAPCPGWPSLPVTVTVTVTAAMLLPIDARSALPVQSMTITVFKLYVLNSDRDCT